MNGTGIVQAILACDGILDSPFAVFNIDEYYVKKRILAAYELVGCVLKNTLLDNGGVTRGVCSVSDGILTGIKETKNIVIISAGGFSQC